MALVIQNVSFFVLQSGLQSYNKLESIYGDFIIMGIELFVTFRIFI